jgi:hypothetical protein
MLREVSGADDTEVGVDPVPGLEGSEGQLEGDFE